MYVVLLRACCALAALAGGAHAQQAADASRSMHASQMAPATPTVSPPSTASLASGEVPPDYFKIDGSKNPELIPDHWVWRGSLLKLATLKGAGQEGDLAPPLTLSEADAAALYKEASLQTKRDAECLHSIQQNEQQMKAKQASHAEIDIAFAELTLACRLKDLDAVDRILDALSDDGRKTLNAWIDEARRSMTVLVPLRDKNRFGLPR